MSEKQLCVIVPIYKERPSENEYHSIYRAAQVFEEDKKFFILPEGMNYSYYQQQFPSFCYQFFSKRYFRNTISYSRLLLTPMFYRSFKEYQYMLISQPDSILLSEDRAEFDYFIHQGVDYWGAVWEPAITLYRYYGRGVRSLPHLLTQPRRCRVGNGGFSLRRIKACIDLLEKHRVLAYLWGRSGNEDCFFAYQGLDPKNQFTLASPELAERFALESNMKKRLEEGQRVYAVHAWEKYFTRPEELIGYFIEGGDSKI
jgi:hypothetical protein